MGTPKSAVTVWTAISGPPTACATFMRCWPPVQPSRYVQPGILTHMSRGNEISAADFETGSMLASIIVSDRVPAIGSSSRLSMPSNRMFTRSVPGQSGRTFFTTDTMFEATCCAGLGAAAVNDGELIVTGTVTLTGPAPSITTGGGAPGSRWAFIRVLSVRQLLTKTPPKTRPPTTKAQKAMTVNSGGPDLPGVMEAM